MFKHVNVRQVKVYILTEVKTIQTEKDENRTVHLIDTVRFLDVVVIILIRFSILQKNSILIVTSTKKHYYIARETIIR